MKKAAFVSLHKRALWVIVLIAVLLAGAIGASARFVMYPRIQLLEQSGVANRVELFNGMLQAELDNLMKTNVDWAFWDFTYDFMRGALPDYLDVQPPEESLLNLRVNTIVMFGLDGKIHYGAQLDLASGKRQAVEPEIIEYVLKYNLYRNTDPHFVNSGLLVTRHGPMLFTLSAIKASEQGDVAGNLVLAILLDEARVAEIARRSSEANIKLVVLDAALSTEPLLTKIGDIPRAPSVSQIYAHQGLITAASALTDIRGQHSIVLLVQLPQLARGIVESGLLVQFIFSLLLCGLVAVIFIWAGERRIFSRLRHMKDQVLAIGESEDLSVRLQGRHLGDEIDILMDETNKMLEKLQQADLRVRSHNEELERLVDERTQSLQAQIEERKRVEKVIQDMAELDDLTRLKNRRSFQKMLLQTQRHAREQKKQFAIFYIDLDGFKEINDFAGHQTGDEVLIEVAQRLGAVFGKQDIVARLGGDEFAVIKSTVQHPVELDVIAEQLIESICKPYLIEGLRFSVTASVGIALYPRDGSTEKEILKNADVAMYLAKEIGKNRYCYANGSCRVSNKSNHPT